MPSSQAADEVLAGQLDERFPAGRLADRLGHPDQHERERGDRQPRDRDAGRRRAAKGAGASQRPRQPGPVVERHLPDGDARRGGGRDPQRRLLPALQQLRDTLAAKATQFDGHRQDRPHAPAGRDAAHARPGVLRLRRAARARAIAHIDGALPHLCELALGGTAVGTGLNAPAGVRASASPRNSRALTGLPFVTAPNKFEALAAHDALVHAHGALKTLAARLMKIANDIRWLASGPRSGIGEIAHPGERAGLARSCRARSTRRSARR